MQKCDPVRRHIKTQINIHIQPLTYTIYKGQLEGQLDWKYPFAQTAFLPVLIDFYFFLATF